jgi:hypothetical protein
MENTKHNSTSNVTLKREGFKNIEIPAENQTVDLN